MSREESTTVLSCQFCHKSEKDVVALLAFPGYVGRAASVRTVIEPTPILA